MGNHLPRHCGIATFTTDLCDAIVGEFADLDCLVLAMNDAGRRYRYPPRVRFEIAESDLGSYRRAADFLNVNGVDVVCVQHEYGIFGGTAGRDLFELLRDLRMPIVTTLHTILAEPSPQQRAVMTELSQLSERLVVMSAFGAKLLAKVYSVPERKIDRIPHGIPSLSSERRSKDQLGVEGKKVILTFGLLSPDKGIENVIDALPHILEHQPDTVYIVLGATHPHVKEHHGEAYRLMLESRARKLGVASNIIFYDRFVSLSELFDFLCAADLYVTPYLKPEQITSGTLAYAVGCGKAVISTPYWYAREILAEGRGVLVPWKDPAAIASAAVDLLGDDAKRAAMSARAAALAPEMLWPAVARSYLSTFEQARVEHAARRRTVFQAKTLAKRPAELPEIALEHVELFTDSTGILQHACFGVPRYEDGYCLDDNARALLAMVLLEDGGTEQARTVRKLASRYLAFVRYAFNPDTRRFRNFMSYARNWLEDSGSEDSHGRALWALGNVVGRSADPGQQSLAGQLFHGALPVVPELQSPRAWAFSLLGIDAYLRAFAGDSSVETVRSTLTEKLLELFRKTRHHDFPWFEDRVTYSNARLSQSLIASGAAMGNEEATRVGLTTLEWLVKIQKSDDGYFAPIGSNGFYRRGGEKAAFDQQPIEASSMVAACLEAERVSADPRWVERARHAFDWFLGHNQLQVPLYDPATGACADGLHPDRRNENRGAESTLSFLLALLEMRAAQRARATHAVAQQA